MDWLIDWCGSLLILLKTFSVSQAMRIIYKEEGVKGYFKGNGTNCVRIFPASAIQFLCYDYYKRVCILLFTHYIHTYRLVAHSNIHTTDIHCFFPAFLA